MRYILEIMVLLFATMANAQVFNATCDSYGQSFIDIDNGKSIVSEKSQRSQLDGRPKTFSKDE